jgi:hypothetical protein
VRWTAARIAVALGAALSTVSAVLKRGGLGKRSRLDPPEPPNRYERRRPGGLIHIDVKKLTLAQVGEVGREAPAGLAGLPRSTWPAASAHRRPPR